MKLKTLTNFVFIAIFLLNSSYSLASQNGKPPFMAVVNDLRMNSQLSSMTWQTNTNPAFGQYIDVKNEMISFDVDTLRDEDDNKYHFILYSDKNNIYAYDPLRLTKIRIVGTNFTNIAFMVSDGGDDHNEYIFVADNNVNNT